MIAFLLAAALCASATESGLVVFAGKPVKPPYRFDYVGDAFQSTTYLNGMAVFPSDALTKMSSARPPMPPADMARNLRGLHGLQLMWNAAAGGKSPEQVLELARSLGVYDTIEWRSPDTIEVTYALTGFLQRLGVRLPKRGHVPTPVTFDEVAQRNLQRFRRQQAFWSRHLKGGGFILIGALGGFVVQPGAARFRADVRAVMDDPSLDLQQKAVRLKRAAGHMAPEIVAAYRPADWR